MVEGAIETLKEAATESKKQAAKAAAEAAENDKAADAAAAAAPQQVVLLKSGNTTTAVVVAAPSGGALATAALGGSKRKKDGEGLLARLTAKLESSPGGRYVLAALAFIAHCAKAFWGFIKWIASLFSPKADEDEQELRGALQGSVLSVYALFTARSPARPPRARPTYDSRARRAPRAAAARPGHGGLLPCGRRVPS